MQKGLKFSYTYLLAMGLESQFKGNIRKWKTQLLSDFAFFIVTIPLFTLLNKTWFQTGKHPQDWALNSLLDHISVGVFEKSLQDAEENCFPLTCCLVMEGMTNSFKDRIYHFYTARMYILHTYFFCRWRSNTPKVWKIVNDFCSLLSIYDF